MPPRKRGAAADSRATFLSPPSSGTLSAGSGFIGVAGNSRSMPMLGLRLKLPDGLRTGHDKGEEETLNDDPETKYEITKNVEKMETYYNFRTVNSPPQPKVFIRGVMEIQHRLVRSKDAHVEEADPSLVSTSSPLKSSLQLEVSSVALVVLYSWKVEGKLNKWEFLVPFENRLDKRAYQKPKISRGDGGATIAFLNKDPDIWTEFITGELAKFEDRAFHEPGLILKYWELIGLQRYNRQQEDDVFIWNKGMAHTFDFESGAFKCVSLSEAGYYSMSLEKLDEVTVCRNRPEFGIIQTIHESLKDVDFLTFLCVAGQCLLACRPRYAHDILKAKLPTTVLIGPPDSGKTFLVELALLLIGSDRQTGKSFSYNHITEHEFGKRTRKGSLPMLVNDPPVKEAKQYAEVVEHVSDGARRQTSALTYDPNAAPILAVNGDFLKAWQKMDAEAWDRVKSRLTVIGVERPVKFPEKREDLYRRAQSLSSHLAVLLKFPTARLEDANRLLFSELSDSLPEDLTDYSSLRRNLENLTLFYAFGEHVGETLNPAFPFRKIARQHMAEVAFPSLSRYLAQTPVADTADSGISSGKLQEVVEDTVQYALEHPEVEWYKWIQWNLFHGAERHRAVAIRATFTTGMFGVLAPAIRRFFQSTRNKVHGCYEKVNFRVPKNIASCGHQAQYSIVFYMAVFSTRVQHQLVALDLISRETQYRAGWEKHARICVKAIGTSDESTLEFATTVDLAVQTVKNGTSEQESAESENEASDPVPHEENSLVVASASDTFHLDEGPSAVSSGRPTVIVLTDLMKRAALPVYVPFFDAPHRSQTLLPESRTTGITHADVRRADYDDWFAMEGKAEAARKLALIGLLPASDNALQAVAADLWRLKSADQVVTIHEAGTSTTGEDDLVVEPTTAVRTYFDTTKETIEQNDLGTKLTEARQMARTVTDEKSVPKPTLDLQDGLPSEEYIDLQSEQGLPQAKDCAVTESAETNGQVSETAPGSSQAKGNNATKIAATAQKNKPESRNKSRKQLKKTAIGGQKKQKLTPCGKCGIGHPGHKIVPCSLNEKCKNWICLQCCLLVKSSKWLEERQHVTDYHLPSSPYFITCSNH